ncbi:hypothetical protein THMIRHAM_19590 [Thiomicrorhabdus immobilis]|uniref:OmpA-like domain-containing protein n=1 Tax=Thiomicrorhabdus immobilis TaxID=2791037 RepID=A0ABN6D2H7_9GAMM|nr:OmpA family protein [Thiomicrorhabdus immobilis]BCN94174.1 hypothetical protein THMIRHAM_19590 [Thiomicrorhabdus immobilis]
MKTKLLPLVAVISLAAAGSVQAHSSVEAKGDIMAEGTSAYVVDSWGRIVRDNENRCVRSIDWSKDTAIAKCEGWEEPKPAPVVAPAPAPAPEPEPIVEKPAPVAPPKFIAHFNFDMFDIKTADIPELNTFADYMNRECTCKIAITGHTDSAGSEAYNQKLSQERAQEVAGYLANHGVVTDRMIVTGAGETNPVADNSTKEGRALNRRVEVEIVK